MNCKWSTKMISEICKVVTDGSHYSPTAVKKGHYMVSVKDFTSFGFDFSGCKQISEEDYKTMIQNGCVPQRNDILIGKDGARYFEDIIIYKQPEAPALLSSIAILRPDESIIFPEYLYYYLKSPNVIKDARENYGSGSAIPRIVLKDFKRMPIFFPDIPTQRRIAAILSSLDKKIKVNKEINDNLAA